MRDLDDTVISRDTVVKHLKDVHNSGEHPTDNRLKYAQEIKEAIKECKRELTREGFGIHM